jgi:hypothetical protein
MAADSPRPDFWPEQDFRFALFFFWISCFGRYTHCSAPDYPRLSLLPSGNVLLSAPAAQTYQFNPTTNVWSFVANTNFGYRYFAPHVLLPGQEKVMVAGGSLTHANGGAAATNTAEIIDMSATTPVWNLYRLDDLRPL